MAATLPASAYPGEEGKIRSDMKDRPPVARRASPWADTLFSAMAHGAAWLTLALLAGILISLVIGAARLLSAIGGRGLAQAVTVIGVLLALTGIIQQPFFIGKIYGLWTS